MVDPNLTPVATNVCEARPGDLDVRGPPVALPLVGVTAVTVGL